MSKQSNEAVRRIARLLGQEAPQDAAQRGYERQKYGVAADDLYDMGVPVVRKSLYTGKYGPPGSPGHKFVSNWLRAHHPIASRTRVLLSWAAAVLAGVVAGFIVWYMGWTK